MPSALNTSSQPSTPPFPPSTLIKIRNHESPPMAGWRSGGFRLLLSLDEREKWSHDRQDSFDVKHLS